MAEIYRNKNYSTDSRNVKIKMKDRTSKFRGAYQL